MNKTGIFIIKEAGVNYCVRNEKKQGLSCDSANYGSSTHQHGTPHSLPTDGLADDNFSASKAASQSAEKCQNMLF
jgi:hypothetical protein